MSRKSNTFINLKKPLLAQEVMAVLQANKPHVLTCREIAEKMTYLHVTNRQIYYSICRLPLAQKMRLNIIYGSGLFKPNRYGIK